MRAVLCRSFCDPLAVEQIDPPVPGSTEVLIDTAFAGINFADSLLVAGLYQDRPPLPFSPGFEVAGRVAEVGEHVEGVQKGDRVMATLPYGGYAEQALAPFSAVIPLPDAVSLQTAAGFPIAFGTAYHALVDRGRLQPGETVLVTGAAGGVGLAAVQVGTQLGARVLAAVGSPAKAELAVAHGAVATIDYTKDNLREGVRRLTDGAGADVVFDPVGGDIFEQCVRSVAWGGRLLVIGFTSGRIPEVPTNLLLLKGSSVVGVFWGSFAARDPEASREHFGRLLRWLEAGSIKVEVTAVYPFEEAAKALAAVAGRQTTGKVVLSLS